MLFPSYLTISRVQIGIAFHTASTGPFLSTNEGAAVRSWNTSMANLCSPTCLAVVLRLSKNITLRQRNRALESPKSRWKNNIKIDLSGIECYKVDWIEPARDRIHWRTFVNIGINRLIPQN